MEINLEDLAAFDESLAEKIQKLPTEYLPVLEEAAKDVADELTAPRPEGEEKMEDIQVLLCSDAHPNSLRGMKVRNHNSLMRHDSIYFCGLDLCLIIHPIHFRSRISFPSSSRFLV